MTGLAASGQMLRGRAPPCRLMTPTRRLTLGGRCWPRPGRQRSRQGVRPPRLRMGQGQVVLVGEHSDRGDRDLALAWGGGDSRAASRNWRNPQRCLKVLAAAVFGRSPLAAGLRRGSVKWAGNTWMKLSCLLMRSSTSFFLALKSTLFCSVQVVALGIDGDDQRAELLDQLIHRVSGMRSRHSAPSISSTWVAASCAAARKNRDAPPCSPGNGGGRLGAPCRLADDQRRRSA